MPEQPAPRLLRAKEAAAYLNMSTRTLWSLSNMGKIPTVRFGTGGRGSVRYDLRDLDAWIEANKAGKR
jgi:excisionase family DNA binding protein